MPGRNVVSNKAFIVTMLRFQLGLETLSGKQAAPGPDRKRVCHWIGERGGFLSAGTQRGPFPYGHALNPLPRARLAADPRHDFHSR